MVDDRQRTPSFQESVKSLIDNALMEVHTALPGEILSYNYDQNRAVVKPLLKRKYKDETQAVELPIISEVPIKFQRFGDAHLRFPVEKGDKGTLFFTERSIDGWLQSGGNLDPLDPRKFSLSDCVFIPGLYPLNDPMASSADQTSVELKYKAAYLELTADNKWKISNGTLELFNELSLLIQNLIDSQDTLGAIFAPDTIVKLQARKDNIDILRKV